MKIKIANCLKPARVQGCEAASCPATDEHALEVEDVGRPKIKESSERRAGIAPIPQAQEAMFEGKPEEHIGRDLGVEGAREERQSGIFLADS